MKLVLVSKRPEVENVYSFIFEPYKPVQWQPGQYMHYVLEHPDADDRGMERWFTISTAPYEKNIMLTTRFNQTKSSSFKKALLALKPGAVVEADGPKGEFTLREGNHHHIFIAGGIGITPFRSMLLQLAHDKLPINVDLLYANHDNNFTFGPELKALQATNSSFHIHEFVDKRNEEQDLRLYLSNKKDVYYLSGVRVMVESYEATLPMYGADKSVVITDYFPGY